MLAQTLQTRNFDQIADLILNQSILYINQKPFEIQEIEFYLKNQEHPDPFVHAHKDQKQFAAWYFHKFGNSYKGGTYKGLDLAFGDQDTYGGILIRSIFNPEKKKFIEGSCLCVEKILKINKCQSIDKLMERFNGSAEEQQNSPLYLKVLDDNRGREIFQCSRVGLGLRKTDDPENRLKYIFKPYRYTLNFARHSKGKLNIFAYLYRQGKDYYQIQKFIPSLKKKTFENYQKEFEEGKNHDPDEYLGNKLSCTKDFLGLYGALS